MDDNKNGLGIASMVLGIISLSFFYLVLPLVLGIIGIILGIIQVARHSIKTYAAVGIATGILSFVLCIGGYAYVFSNSAFMEMIYNEFVTEMIDDGYL